MFSEKNKLYKKKNVAITDYSLNVLIAIKSPMLRMLKNKYKIEVLEKYWNEDKFEFFWSYEGDVMNEFIDIPRGVLKIEFNPQKMNEDTMGDLLRTVYEDVSQQAQVYDTQNTDLESFEFNDEQILRHTMTKFIDVIMSDDKLAELIYLNHLEKMIFDNVWVIQKELYTHKPLISVGEDMKDRNTLVKALERYQIEYDKYKDNPTLAGKFKRKIEELRRELKHYDKNT